MIKPEPVKFLEVVRDSNGQIIQVNDALASLNVAIASESKLCQSCVNFALGLFPTMLHLRLVSFVGQIAIVEQAVNLTKLKESICIS